MNAADKPSGPAAAAILSAAIGVFVIGLATTMAEVTSTLRNALIWLRPVGPLSGKTGVGVIIWILAWVILASRFRGKNVEMGGIARWSWILIALGLLGTFPLFFELFTQ